MTKEAAQGTLSFHYKFTFSDGSAKDFNVVLDRETLDLVPKERDSKTNGHDCPITNVQTVPSALNETRTLSFPPLVGQFLTSNKL